MPFKSQSDSNNFTAQSFALKLEMSRSSTTHRIATVNTSTLQRESSLQLTVFDQYPPRYLHLIGVASYHNISMQISGVAKVDVHDRRSVDAVLSFHSYWEI